MTSVCSSYQGVDTKPFLWLCDEGGTGYDSGRLHSVAVDYFKDQETRGEEAPAA
jgi:hypothetical protein